MNPDDDEPIEPIDPPDNTGGGSAAPEADADADVQKPAIQPPDNT